MRLHRVGHHWATELNWLKVKEVLFKQSASKKSASDSFYSAELASCLAKCCGHKRGWPVEVETLPTVVLHHNQHCISWLGKSWKIQDAENTQLRLSLLEFINFTLLLRLPDCLRSVLKRWQRYLLRTQLPCSFSLPHAFSLNRTSDTEVDICTWKWYTENWKRLESLPLSTCMWLLTTEIYNFWGTSNTWAIGTSIYHPLLSFKNSFLIFAITWQVYISLLYPLSSHHWLLI